MPVFYSADNASNGNLLLVAILLFVQWGIGHATLGKQEWNTGILLLVWQLSVRPGLSWEVAGGDAKIDWADKSWMSGFWCRTPIPEQPLNKAVTKY